MGCVFFRPSVGRVHPFIESGRQGVPLSTSTHTAEEVVSPRPLATTTGMEQQRISVEVVIESTPTEDGDNSSTLNKKCDPESERREADTVIQDLEDEEHPPFSEELITTPATPSLSELKKADIGEVGVADHTPQRSVNGSKDILRMESVNSLERELTGDGPEEVVPGRTADSASTSKLDATIVVSSKSGVPLSVLARGGLVTENPLKCRSATVMSEEQGRAAIVRPAHSQTDVDKKSSDISILQLQPTEKSPGMASLQDESKSSENVKEDSDVSVPAITKESGPENKLPSQTDKGRESPNTSSHSLEKSEETSNETSKKDDTGNTGKESLASEQASAPPANSDGVPPTEMGLPPPTETSASLSEGSTDWEGAPSETSEKETKLPADNDTPPIAADSDTPPNAADSDTPPNTAGSNISTEKPVIKIQENSGGSKEGSNDQAPPLQPSLSLSKRTEDSDSRKIAIDHNTGQSSTIELGGGDATPTSAQAPVLPEVPAAV